MSNFFTKVFCAAFLSVLLSFVTFWPKNIGTKAASKMLMKLTTEVELMSFYGTNETGLLSLGKTCRDIGELSQNIIMKVKTIFILDFLK